MPACNQNERMIFIVIQHAKQTTLIKKYWDLYESKKELPYIVKPSMPIMYFGNIKKYLESPIRIVTVGLNPSRRDFPEPDPFQRFQSMKQDHYYHFNQQYISALNQYFDDDPYNAWYNPAFENMLNGLDASFYNKKENTALHTDICTPLATNPTWGDLTKEAKMDLQATGVPLWHELIDYLEPDIILISAAGEHLSKIQFETVKDWETIYTSLRDKPYLINSKQVKLSSGKVSSIYFGRASELPFGLVGAEEQFIIGKHIKTITEKAKNPAAFMPFIHPGLKVEGEDGDMFGWGEKVQ